MRWLVLGLAACSGGAGEETPAAKMVIQPAHHFA